MEYNNVWKGDALETKEVTQDMNIPDSVLLSLFMSITY